MARHEAILIFAPYTARQQALNDGDRVCHCPEEPLVDDTLFIDQPDDQGKAEAKPSPCSVTSDQPGDQGNAGGKASPRSVTSVLPGLCTMELSVVGATPIDQPHGCLLGDILCIDALPMVVVSVSALALLSSAPKRTTRPPCNARLKPCKILE